MQDVSVTDLIKELPVFSHQPIEQEQDWPDGETVMNVRRFAVVVILICSKGHTKNN